MSWNYRVIRKQLSKNEEIYEIHEVFYSEKGKIENWSADPIAPHGSSASELLNSIMLMLECLQKPILEVVNKKGKETLEEI